MNQTAASAEHPALSFDILRLIVDTLGAEHNYTKHDSPRTRVPEQALHNLSLTARDLREMCQSHLFHQIEIGSKSLSKITCLAEALAGESGLQRHVRALKISMLMFTTDRDENDAYWSSHEDYLKYSHCAIQMLRCMSNVEEVDIWQHGEDGWHGGLHWFATSIGVELPPFLVRNPVQRLIVFAERLPISLLAHLPPKLAMLKIKAWSDPYNDDVGGTPVQTSVENVLLDLSAEVLSSLVARKSVIQPLFNNLTSCSIIITSDHFDQLYTLYALAVLPAAQTLQQLEVKLYPESSEELDAFRTHRCSDSLPALPNLARLSLCVDVSNPQVGGMCPPSIAAFVRSYASSATFKNIETLKLRVCWMPYDDGIFKSQTLPTVLDRQRCGWDKVDEYLSDRRAVPNLKNLLLDFAPVSARDSWIGILSQDGKNIHRCAARDVYDVFCETRKRAEVKFKVPYWYSGAGAGTYANKWDWSTT